MPPDMPLVLAAGGGCCCCAAELWANAALAMSDSPPAAMMLMIFLFMSASSCRGEKHDTYSASHASCCSASNACATELLCQGLALQLHVRAVSAQSCASGPCAYFTGGNGIPPAARGACTGARADACAEGSRPVRDEAPMRGEAYGTPIAATAHTPRRKHHGWQGKQC